MKLKSNICTIFEQSKKLIKLGLKPETADLTICMFQGRSNPVMLTWVESMESLKKEGLENDGTISPAWSLSRLIELMPTEISEKKTGASYDLYILPDGNEINYSIAGGYKVLHSVCLDGPEATLFDAIIEMIDWLIKNNYFNKEYLCNK